MTATKILKLFVKSKYGFDPEKELVIITGRGIEIVDEKLVYNDNKVDGWNDLILLCSPKGDKKYKGTVDPGLDFMKQPINPGGTGRLESGVLWLKRGLHRGYQALIQSRVALVRRDSNRDLKFTDEDPTQKGFYGANFHGASSLKRVGRSSAMCVVVMLLHTSKEFKDLIAWIYSFEQKEFPCVIIEQRELALFIGGLK